MNPLHLSGWGVKVRVQNLESRSELEIIDGREDNKVPSEMRFRPRRFPYSSIVIDGHSGYISLQAFHWLSRNRVPVFVTDYDGSVISSVLPPMSVKADLRTAQIQAVTDSKKKFKIAMALVEAKTARSLQVLDWLGERYDLNREIRLARKEAFDLHRARTVSDIRSVEGRVAAKYWKAFNSALPEHLVFPGRMTTSHQNASDPVNLALNYGYGFLEGECRSAINSVGLEPAVGFLHDCSCYQTKQSLVYDLEEPFRWLIDVSVIEAFESDTLKLQDFYFMGGDYRYHFEVEAKRRFINLLRERFNAGVTYRGRNLRWDTVIEQKTIELGRFLTGKSAALDFAEPSPKLIRHDDRELRGKILALTQSEAKELGIGRSTLHYLRRNVNNDRSFKVYRKVKAKLHLPIGASCDVSRNFSGDMSCRN